MVIDVVIDEYTTTVRGHKIKYNIENDKWFYLDNGKELDNNRPCIKCGKLPTSEDYDACLGKLPGVKNACCGHGVEEGYIQFDDGTTIRFNLTGIDND